MDYLQLQKPDTKCPGGCLGIRGPGSLVHLGHPCPVGDHTNLLFFVSFKFYYLCCQSENTYFLSFCSLVIEIEPRALPMQDRCSSH